MVRMLARRSAKCRGAELVVEFKVVSEGLQVCVEGFESGGVHGVFWVLVWCWVLCFGAAGR